jgi:hypothetical protein
MARHPWAARLALVVLGTGLGLAAAELMVRVAAPQELRVLGGGAGLIVPDARYGYALKPNATFEYLNGTIIHTNSLGLRDHEYGPKLPGEIRVLSIGDSYGFGSGVLLEETYSKVLERRLRERFPGTPVSVIVAAVAGWNTYHMTMAFEDLSGPLGADFVIVTFVAGNDVQSNWKFEAQRRQQLLFPVGPLGRHLHTARLLRRIASPAEQFLTNRDPRRIAFTIDLLRALEGKITAAGLPYLMLVIPARHQIRPRVEPFVETLQRLGLWWLVVIQNERVLEHFRREGVPHVDLLPALAARDPIEPVVFDHDAHTNAAGHRLIAEETFRAIEGPMAALVDGRRSVAASGR